MINIKSFVCNMLQENCYIVNDETKQCVIIDCGAYYPEEQQAIREYICKNKLEPVHLIATHGHLDHNFGNAFIYKDYGLLPEVHENDSKSITHLNKQASDFFGMETNIAETKVGRLLEDRQFVTFGNQHFKVLHTPGHSAGSIVLYCEEENIIFTGDTLFHHSIGRTDFEDGSMFAIIQSLRIISQLPDKTIVYPGHGITTTIGEEIRNNPYIDR